MSLKARLALVNALQIIAVLAGTLGIVYFSVRSELLARAAQQRAEALAHLAHMCTATLDAREEKILLSDLSSFMESPEVEEVSLWSDDGTLQIDSDFLHGDYSGVSRTLPDALLAKARAATSPFSEASTAAGGRVERLEVAPVFSQGKRFGFVMVTYDQAKSEAVVSSVLQRAGRELLLIGLVACALAVAIAWVVAAGIVRPIGALGAAAREIGAGRFPAAIGVERSDELGALARELSGMAERLKRADEFKDHFLRAISHNMRSPLAAVESAAYHARHYVDAGAPRALEDFRIIERGVKELTSFINNLLDLERIKAGRMTFRFEKIDVRSLLDQVCQLYERLAEEKGVGLTVVDAGAGRPVALDQNLMGQTLSNLVVNALKFTPSGGRIELAAANEGAGVLITVSDTGPGIPPEKLPEVFQKFRQFGAGPADARGSGLGLALCKEVVEAHGGRIWVENRPGGGARFSLWLPEKPETSREAVAS